RVSELTIARRSAINIPMAERPRSVPGERPVPASIPRPIQPDGRVHGVVVACQGTDGQWLCIRRSRHVAAPLEVWFPGGAIDIGESQESAVVREMREELGVLVRPIRCVWHWISPTSTLTLWGWRAELIPGPINLDELEVAEVLWLSTEQVAAHPDGLPSN